MRSVQDELRRLEDKKLAGDELVMTQPVYDPRTLERRLDQRFYDLGILRVGIRRRLNDEDAAFAQQIELRLHDPRGFIRGLDPAHERDPAPARATRPLPRAGARQRPDLHPGHRRRGRNGWRSSTRSAT